MSFRQLNGINSTIHSDAVRNVRIDLSDVIGMKPFARLIQHSGSGDRMDFTFPGMNVSFEDTLCAERDIGNPTRIDTRKIDQDTEADECRRGHTRHPDDHHSCNTSNPS